MYDNIQVENNIIFYSDVYLVIFLTFFVIMIVSLISKLYKINNLKNLFKKENVDKRHRFILGPKKNLPCLT